MFKSIVSIYLVSDAFAAKLFSSLKQDISKSTQIGVVAPASQSGQVSQNIDKAISIIQRASQNAGDGLFSLNYDFLAWIEDQAAEQGNEDTYLPADLELKWQTRRNRTMRDVLQSMHKFVAGSNSTDSDYFEWLHKVYDWEVSQTAAL